MVPQGQSRVLLPGGGLGAELANIPPHIYVEMPQGKQNSEAGQDGEVELRVIGLKV